MGRRLMRVYVDRLKKVLDKLSLDRVEYLSDLISAARRVYVIGNGGSMATASHFAEDLVKLVRKPAFVLSDSSLLSMVGNDEGFSNLFRYPLRCLAEDDFTELIIGITMGGVSKNVLRVMTDLELRCHKFLITGFGGSGVECDKLVIPTRDIQIAEDVTLALTHMVCRKLEVKR